MRIDPRIGSILDKALSGGEISAGEAVELMKIDENSHEMYALMSAGNTLTRRQFGDTGEVYAQVGINLWPCHRSCAFCFFGEDWNLIRSPGELSPDEVVLRVKAFEEAGANGIFLMTTADYPFERFIEIGRAVREAVSPRMPLAANIGDFTAEQARQLVDAGFQGVYHVFRLREGRDTRVDPEVRLRTFRTIRDSGLALLSCVEPIGPEHSPEEVVEAMFRGREFGAVNFAAMWRVPVPGTPLAAKGKISEVSLAKAVAVTRLVFGDTIRSMGVHEPRVLGMRAGANSIAAEAGPNPRDTAEDTAKGIGYSVEACRNLLREAGYTPLQGYTKAFQK
ncbi:MAG: radical SAM protein [Deferribacteres bacterium]|nr:radical SAM protein [Deferribacteres bacterium]